MSNVLHICPHDGTPEHALKQIESELYCTLHATGNLELLFAPRRALLVSRVQRKCTPVEPWVRGMIDATTHAVQSGETIVAGVDRLPWQLALNTCRRLKGSAIVVSDGTLSAGDILPKNMLWIRPQWDSSASKELTLLLRDKLIGRLADRAFAIQLRPAGNMVRVIEAMEKRGAEITPWNCASVIHVAAPSVEPVQRRGPLRPISFANRLTHFTREPDDVWPGESFPDYLAWLASGPNYVPRDAFQALRNILTEQRIRACGRLIRKKTPMVCFTQRNPAELFAENRWRKGLLRRAYSHYAISFALSDLVKFGVRPVHYVAREALDNAEGDEAFWQIENSGNVDWKKEEEWRVRGDVDFGGIDCHRIVALVQHEHEACQIEREFGVKARIINCSRQTGLSD